MSLLQFTDYGVGVDIESIDRFKNKNHYKDKVFLQKIFTRKELDYCFLKKNYAQHLTARFAGKEAVVKAFGSINKSAPVYSEIEIINNSRGVPTVIITKKEYKKYTIKLSLAHNRHTAVASAIVLC